jgi:1-acyl-sn-glycerol-3-phosphate acyltransferase
MRDLALWRDKVLPPLKKLVDIGYFRMEVEGLENIPRDEPLVFVSNHAGWIALDGFMGVLGVTEALGEEYIPQGAVLDLLFKLPVLGDFLTRLGMIPASSWLNVDPEKESLKVFSMFPEGANGNCKPFWKAYRMNEWKTGFVKLALKKRAKVVPLLIIGGEECLPCLTVARTFTKWLKTEIPVPMLPFPLPTRWKLVALPAHDFSIYDPSLIYDRTFCQEKATEIRNICQKALDEAVQDRWLFKVSRFLAKEA